MNMQVTESQKARAAAEWSEIAGELVQIEASDLHSPVYAYGSELACLRLFHKMPKGRAQYSENMGTWFFASR